MLGTETVARLLGLRLNHPPGSEHLERAPKQPASRAEAAYSLAKLLTARGLARQLDPAARGRRSSCPTLSELAARRPREGASVRRLPVRLRGDVREDAEALERDGAGRHDHRARRLRLLGARLAGLQARAVRAGARCSRGVLKGRTTYAMSGEVARPLRIDPAALAARRRRLLREQGAEVEADRRSATRGSTSATAGSSTRRAAA